MKTKKKDKVNYIDLFKNGSFYDSLKDKKIYVSKNNGGGIVVIGISNK